MAIQSKDGDELVDITVTQSWWYAYVLGFKVKVHGMVLRDLELKKELGRRYDHDADRVRDRQRRARQPGDPR